MRVGKFLPTFGAKKNFLRQEGGLENNFSILYNFKYSDGRQDASAIGQSTLTAVTMLPQLDKALCRPS